MTSSSSSSSSTSSNGIYFERQSLMRCGVHTVNNMFQSHLYTPSDFSHIASQLHTEGRMMGTASRWNSHESIVGIGNWDINVLMRAISDQGYTVHWLNRKQPISSLSHIHSFILNIHRPFPLLGRISSYCSTQHWFPITYIHDKHDQQHGYWYILDSTKEPKRVENEEALRSYLAPHIANTKTQILYVVKSDNEGKSNTATATATETSIETKPKTSMSTSTSSTITSPPSASAFTCTSTPASTSVAASPTCSASGESSIDTLSDTLQRTHLASTST